LTAARHAYVSHKEKKKRGRRNRKPHGRILPLKSTSLSLFTCSKKKKGKKKVSDARSWTTATRTVSKKGKRGERRNRRETKDVVFRESGRRSGGMGSR